jgi:hypothetical protein
MISYILKLMLLIMSWIVWGFVASYGEPTGFWLSIWVVLVLATFWMAFLLLVIIIRFILRIPI